MDEPVAGMAGGDAKASALSNAPERDRMTGAVLTDVLLLQCPSGLDRVEIGRVRGEIDDPDAALLAGRNDSGVVMRRKIVEDDHVARCEPREQLPLQPTDEAMPVGRLEHRRQHHPAGQPDGAEEGQVGAPIHRHALDVLAPAFHPSVRPTHREIEARFVEKHELLDRDAQDATTERPSLPYDVRPQALQGPLPFFFTTYP